MARVPITVMGFKCERCEHEWIPRNGSDGEPTVCPSCKSPYWNRPRKKAMMTYDDFKTGIERVLREAGEPRTWTEIRTAAKLPQKWPNNAWVHRLEQDIRLRRTHDAHGIIHWSLAESGVESVDATGKPTDPAKRTRPRADRKAHPVE
jgi:hypothetical protein